MFPTCFEEEQHFALQGLFVLSGAVQMILLMSAGLCRPGSPLSWVGESLEARPRTSNAPSVAHRPPAPAGLPGQQEVGGADDAQGGAEAGVDPQRGEVVGGQLQAAGDQQSKCRRGRRGGSGSEPRPSRPVGCGELPRHHSPGLLTHFSPLSVSYSQSG